MNNKELLNQLLEVIQDTFRNYNYEATSRPEQIGAQLNLSKIVAEIIKHSANPALLGYETLEEQMRGNSVALRDIHTNVEKISYLNQEILLQEEELSKQEHLMKEKKARIDYLEKLKIQLESFYKINPDIVIKQLQEETANKEITILTYLENLKSVLDKASNEIQVKVLKLADVIAKDVHNFDNFNIEQLGNLRNSNLQIHSKFDSLDAEYNVLWGKYTTCYEKLLDLKTELEGLKDVHEKNMQVYDQHFKDNQQVWGSLESRGYVSRYVLSP